MKRVHLTYVDAESGEIRYVLEDHSEYTVKTSLSQVVKPMRTSPKDTPLVAVPSQRKKPWVPNPKLSKPATISNEQTRTDGYSDPFFEEKR